ncbi:uncharacterized protein LOC123202857 [Mangifera indica]|uniref:uncharacterized protein LOC123202857 n=1 Tax=Mangifera indica TaxID=29780 RepID=UPI001CFB1A82|nr:uncharacterized protein LOC123202857 [Mangifera indica]
MEPIKATVIDLSSPESTTETPQMPAFRLVPTNKNKPKPGDVLYASPLDGPELVLTKQVLIGVEDYAQWARDFRRALIAKDKIGFVDGTVPMLSEPDLARFWVRCNTLVHAWISNCLTEEIAAGLPPTEDARELWGFIKDINPTRESDCDELLQQAFCCLERVRCSRGIDRCATGDSHADSGRQGTGEMTRFLMGLNEGFAAFRTQILTFAETPSLQRTYHLAV